MESADAECGVREGLRKEKGGTECGIGWTAREDVLCRHIDSYSSRRLFSGRCCAAASGPHLPASAAGDLRAPPPRRPPGCAPRARSAAGPSELGRSLGTEVLARRLGSRPPHHLISLACSLRLPVPSRLLLPSLQVPLPLLPPSLILHCDSVFQGRVLGNLRWTGSPRSLQPQLGSTPPRDRGG